MLGLSDGSCFLVFAIVNGWAQRTRLENVQNKLLSCSRLIPMTMYSAWVER
jgi:hypothetical protein